MAFKNNLKRLREKEGLSQAQLADRIGVSQAAISYFESGEAMPRPMTLKVVADYFHVSVKELTKE